MMANATMRLRFNLRSLLILVALSAFACWAYWIGWPWWEQVRFESALRQLKAGATAYDVMQLRKNSSSDFTGDAFGNSIGMTTFVVPDGIYCAYFLYPHQSGGMLQRPSTSVSVFRLPRVPPGYGYGPDRENKYIRDFLSVISNHSVNDPLLKYELIHADPPQAAK